MDQICVCGIGRENSSPNSAGGIWKRRVSCACHLNVRDRDDEGGGGGMKREGSGR